MCWFASIRTNSSLAPVMPTRRSSRISNRSGGRRARIRASSRVSPSSGPRLALASSTGVPSSFSAQTRVFTAPAGGTSAKARTASPSITMLR